jgi:hypothetical protein
MTDDDGVWPFEPDEPVYCRECVTKLVETDQGLWCQRCGVITSVGLYASGTSAEVVRLREALTALTAENVEAGRQYERAQLYAGERDEALAWLGKEKEETARLREALTAAEAALAVKRAKAAMFESWIRTNHPDAEILAENIVAAASDGHEHVWQDTGFANLDDCAICGKTRPAAASDGEADK